MRKSLAATVCLLVCALLFSACSRRQENTITLAGSTAFQPFAEKLAENYLARNPDVHVNVQGGGSAVGILSALGGTAQIGMADLIKLPNEAKALASTVVARDGIAIIVNPANPVTNLSSEQAKGIFSGKITSWEDLGGTDSPIRVISREEGSGTRQSFDELVLGTDKVSKSALFQDSNGTVREAVANDPNSIGYISTGLVNDKVKPILYDGIAPTHENLKSARYRLIRPIFFLTNKDPSENTKKFIDYVMSTDAQKILEEEGLIAAK